MTPGHLFPLQAKKGGVLRRTGHTEACVDLARLIELERLAEKHGLKMVTIESLISYRMQREKPIQKVSPRGAVSTRLMELETAKEILAEVFHARPADVEEMIQKRLEERNWPDENEIWQEEREEGRWPATFLPG